jgi:hypothetical protein
VNHGLYCDVGLLVLFMHVSPTSDASAQEYGVACDPNSKLANLSKRGSVSYLM